MTGVADVRRQELTPTPAQETPVTTRSVVVHLVSRAPRRSGKVALGLSGVLQAVDGVALKQAVDAWVSAPDAEEAARFASAETVRWLE